MNIKGLFAAMKAGEALDNSVTVRQWANAAQMLTVILSAVVVILRTCGVDLELDDAKLGTIAMALIIIVGTLRTMVSSMVNVAPVLPPIVTAPVETIKEAAAPKPPEEPPRG